MAEQAVRLKKGNKLRLTKMISYKEKVSFALSWNTNRYRGGRDFDLDLSMVCLNEDEICQDDKYFIWYEHKIAPKGAIRHSGDNKVGVSDEDDDAEVIEILFDKIPEWVKSIVAVVTIYDAGDDQHFGVVDNAYVRLLDNNNEEKLRFSLSEETKVERNIGMIFGRLNRINSNEWEFEAIEEGSNNELEEYIELYGMDLYEIIKKYAPRMLEHQ